MYLHQHPTYRRLSAQFARRSKHYPDEVAPHMRHTHYPDETEATAAAATATATAAAVSANNNGSSGLSSHDFVGWERIGKGGFGKVYRAKPRNGRGYRHGTDSDGYVAVKVVDKRALKDSAAEMRLAAEVAIHESVAHAGVVQLHESFEDDRFVYLVMEHCAAGDLWRYLRQRGSGGSDG
ncbi:Serine/threonine-protein kinase plk4, partial [Coemansia sp. RSA 2320]